MLRSASLLSRCTLAQNAVTPDESTHYVIYGYSAHVQMYPLVSIPYLVRWGQIKICPGLLGRVTLAATTAANFLMNGRSWLSVPCVQPNRLILGKGGGG